jgi:hypothetical protein
LFIDKNIMVLQDTIEYKFTDETFKKHVTDEDIQFLVNISEESYNFELINSPNDKMNIFFSKNNVI